MHFKLRMQIAVLIKLGLNANTNLYLFSNTKTNFNPFIDVLFAENFNNLELSKMIKFQTIK